VKFSRLVIQLKPEPWAYVERYTTEGGPISHTEDVVTWKEGQLEVDPSTVSSIFSEELKAAGVPVDGGADSLFTEDSAANLRVGARVTAMNGRFCQSCERLGFSGRWQGAVVMDAHWEVFSSLDRKVVAEVETHGGFSAPKRGLDGDPERLVYEAFRDNVRQLVNSQEFRTAVMTRVRASAETVAVQSAMRLDVRGARSSVPQASKSVAVVYAADGSGSGFLVSADGYLITNRHVVGGSKYVKLKWSDGSESLGEVVRSDRRRDVALVKTDAGGRAPLALRHTAVQQGETVFAIGTPLEDRLQNTMTRGIVSASRTYEGQPFIQSDVAVTHGNSGGPLLDEKGSVIGLTVMGLHPDETQSLNLFIPIDDALKALAVQPAA
jgi:S1-C subfamily serine protease